MKFTLIRGRRRSSYARKFLRIIKITLVLLTTALLQRTYAGQVQKITLAGNNIKLKQVFDKIQAQTKYRFLYTDEMLSESKPINVNATTATVENVLDKCFTGLPLTYTIDDQTIIVKRKPTRIINNPSRSEVSIKITLQLAVSGKITDSNGQALPGVSVNLKGTKITSSTNNQGNYNLSIPDGNGILIFSYIGYTTQQISVNGRTRIDVSLAEESKSLSTVVVTALGIKREAKTLGYSTVVVNHDQVTENRTNSTLGTLQGKVSGVNITTLGTGPQGSAKIRIRGNSSFSGTNSPLIVLNGVPIDNSQFGGQGLNNSDGGDGLSSINPDDIESMTVLKGAAAAALYGSRAKDGVVMITTKLKGSGKGFGVEYNVNFTSDTPLDFTDFQYEYGQGERGVRPTAPNPTSGVWSFGEKFQPGMTQILFDGIEVPYEPVYNRVAKFYDIGKNLTNTISLSNNSDKGGFNLSISNTDNKSIVPNSDFNRRTINLGFIQNISQKLSVQGNVNYSNEYNRNPAQVGGQEFSTPSSVFTVANSMPFDLLNEYRKDAAGNEIVWNRFLPRTNPYFSVYEHFENVKRDRVFGNLSVKYDFTKWLYLQARIAQDYYDRNQDYNYPTGYAAIGPAPAGYVNGSYYKSERKFRERNYDFLLGSSHKFEDFGINLTLGGNQMYRRADQNNVSTQDFIQRGLYTIMNGRTKDPNYNVNERKVNSFYGAAEISFKDYFFLNVTGRNDWFSTLSPANRSIFYPSATGSFVFSEAIHNMPKWLSFGKLRLAYAEVGDDNVSAYSNALYYQVNNNLFANPSGSLIPVGGINATVVPNGDLRPLRVSEAEAGVDLRLFNNKIGFDLTFYRKISKDQIVSAQISSATAFTSQLINVGKSMNKGIEMAISASPVKTSSFRWSVDANVSYNTSKVLKLGLGEDDNMISIGGIREVVGMPMGQIYEYMYLRDAQGRQVFDKSSGFPLRTAERVNVGSNQPEYFGGITNSFNYKGVSISALVDFKLGKNYILSGGSNRNYWRHGLHKGTLPGRDVGYVIGDGVNQDGGVNSTKAEVQPFYESVTGLTIAEPFIYNAGFWKLRQITVGYDFNKFLPANSFIKGVKLSLVANNVAVIKKWTENMDPEEVYGYSDNNSGAGWSSLPLTRSLGFNVNVKF
jgi:TonB-linked SusC/RagA family outer membrane protein